MKSDYHQGINDLQPKHKNKNLHMIYRRLEILSAQQEVTKRYFNRKLLKVIKVAFTIFHHKYIKKFSIFEMLNTFNFIRNIFSVQ